MLALPGNEEVIWWGLYGPCHFDTLEVSLTIEIFRCFVVRCIFAGLPWQSSWLTHCAIQNQ